MTFIVKQPFIWSTSGYNSPQVQITDSVINVAAALCRASLGTPAWMGSVDRATDHSFPIYWPQWNAARKPRCAYHFLENGAGGADQAVWFLHCVNEAGGFHRGDRIAIDVEDYQGQYSIREILDFIYNVHYRVPIIPYYDYLLYSRQDIMNPLSLTKLNDDERDILLQVYQWPAGYPSYPDQWSTQQLIDAYHFDYGKYGPVALVQYAGAAVIEGLSKIGQLSIECNVADPAYLARWQADAEEYYTSIGGDAPDVITTPLNGVRVTTGRRFGSDVRIIEIEKPYIIQVRMTVPDGMRKVGAVQGDIVINGGDFNMTTGMPVGLYNANGENYAPQVDFEPSLGFLSDGTAQMDHKKTDWPNAVAVKRYLLVNGGLNPVTTPEWSNREPRNIFGVNPDGDLIVIQSKGRQLTQAGLTLFEGANVAMEFGAIVAGDGDGGESVQSRVAGEVFEGTLTPRPVGDFIVIMLTASGGSMLQAQEKLGKSVTIRKTACAVPDNSTTFSIPPKAIVNYVKVVDDLEHPGDVAYKWLQLNDAGTQFANYIYPPNGLRFDLLNSPEPPPEPPPTTPEYILTSWHLALKIKQPDGTYKDVVFDG